MPRQVSADVEDLRKVFDLRVAHMKILCMEWLEANNKAHAPIPETEEAATEWMLLNDLIPIDGKAPVCVTPKKTGDRWSMVSLLRSFDLCYTDVPFKTPALSQSGWSTVCATPSATPSPRKRVASQVSVSYWAQRSKLM